MLLDLRILELLASKICHDLISPVGAINNGVELIEDIGPSVTEEAMKLISNSAQHAARRLKMFRIAYGRAGGEGVTLRDTRKTAVDYLGHGKMELKWDEGLDLYAFSEKPGALKLLLCGLIVAEEALSHGGTISVSGLEKGEGDSLGVSITAAGSHATISDAIRTALTGKATLEEIVPRNVHAYATHCFIEHYGLKITVQQVSDQELKLAITS